MIQRISLSVLAGAVLLLAPAGLSAQDVQAPHTVDRGELERAIVEADGAEEAGRRAIRSVLERDAVRAAAEAHGIDLVRAKDAVSTLQGEELDRVSARAERVDEALAGGDDTIVISATTLIIALLVLIIILVA